MQIRNKFYPYPVIIEDGDYYVESKFSSSVEQKMDGYNIKLKIKTELINPQLEKMLEEGDVEIVHHLECSQTCYRVAVQTKDPEFEYLITDDKVNGVLEICSFLVAKRTIERYDNIDFSENYRGFKFDMHRGCVLAVGNQYKINIEKIKDDLKNTSSIFSIIPNADPMETTMSVNLESDKIVISLPKEGYQKYYHTQSYMEIQPVMHSMIIVPALIYTLSELRRAGDQLYEFEDYRWLRSLRKTCENLGVTIDDRTLNNTDLVKLAQQLLNSPLSKALECCSMGGYDHED